MTGPAQTVKRADRPTHLADSLAGQAGARIDPAPTGGWIRRMMPFLAVHKRDVWLAVLASAVGQAANGIGPVVQKVIVDDGIVHHTRSVTPWLVLLGVLATI